MQRRRRGHRQEAGWRLGMRLGTRLHQSLSPREQHGQLHRAQQAAETARSTGTGPAAPGCARAPEPIRSHLHLHLRLLSPPHVSCLRAAAAAPAMHLGLMSRSPHAPPTAGWHGRRIPPRPRPLLVHASCSPAQHARHAQAAGCGFVRPHGQHQTEGSVPKPEQPWATSCAGAGAGVGADDSCTDADALF